MAFSNKQLAALLFADAGAGKRQCRLCGKHYARGNGYTNLLTHLRGSHADYEARALDAAARRQQRRQAVAHDVPPAATATATAITQAATPNDVPNDVPSEVEEVKASQVPIEAAVEVAVEAKREVPSDQADEERRVEAECRRVEAALSTLGKRRRAAAAAMSTPPRAAVEDVAALSPPEKQRKLAQLPASMHEVYALHSARKMELAHKKLRAELALQERRLTLEAAKERNRTVLELVKLGKTPEEIEKLMPLFS